MRRGFWFVAGAGAGVYAMVRGRRAAEALTVDGLRDRLSGLEVAARMFRDEVAQGRVEKETELRERYGLVPHGTPELEGGRHRAMVSTGSTQPTGSTGGTGTAPTTPGQNRKAATDGHRGDPPSVRRSFRAQRAPGGAVCIAAPRRPEPAVRQRGDGAVQALLPGPGDPAVPPRHQRAEVRAHPRHRGRRQDHAPRHVLRDVRQLLLRRLLQGRRHRARLGAGHPAPRGRWLRAAREQALPERLRGRRRGRRAVAQDHRASRRPDHPAGEEGELLVHGRARARWTRARRS